MPNILIRDLPTETLDVLKTAAQESHRSLQGELHTLITREAKRLAARRKLTLHLAKANRPTKVSDKREEIYGDDGR